MKIEFEAKGVIITSKGDKAELHGNDRVVRIDVDFKGLVDIDVLEKFATGEDRANYAKMLFDDKDQFKTLGLKKLVYERDYEGHNVTIKLNDLQENKIELTDVSVKKFVAEPTFGKMSGLTFQIQCHPGDEQLSALSNAVGKKDLTVVITAPETVDESDEDKQETMI
jgi:hypothetical protein